MLKRGETDILAPDSGDIQEEKTAMTKISGVATEPTRDGNVNEARVETTTKDTPLKLRLELARHT